MTLRSIAGATGALVIAVGLAGCQTTGTAGAVGTTAKPGKPAVAAQAPLPPPPADYKQQILAKLKETMKDPYSIRSAEITPPGPGWVGIFNGGTQQVVCLRFNAKNSFGAYNGVKTWAAAWRAGKIIAIIEDPITRCDDRSWSPFPEAEHIT